MCPVKELVSPEKECVLCGCLVSYLMYRSVWYIPRKLFSRLHRRLLS